MDSFLKELGIPESRSSSSISRANSQFSKLNHSKRQQPPPPQQATQSSQSKSLKNEHSTLSQQSVSMASASKSGQSVIDHTLLGFENSELLFIEGILHIYEVNLHENESDTISGEWKDVYYKVLYEGVTVHKSKKQSRPVWKERLALKYNTSNLLRFEFWEKKIGVCCEFRLNYSLMKNNKPFFFNANLYDLKKTNKPTKFFIYKMQVVFKFEKVENISDFSGPCRIPEIQWNDLIFAGKLGHGGSGTVLLAQWHGAGVAVKQLSGVGEQSDISMALREFHRELESLVSCRHPNIVNFYGICTRPPHLALVFEYVQLGSLDKIIHQEKVIMCLLLKYRIIRDIIKGLAFLHSQQFIHRDLKPANILMKSKDLNREVNVVLCDFGISKKIGGVENTAYLGTPRYMAPELQTESYTTSVDLYSFAITTWEIFTEKIPFDSFQHSFEIMRYTFEGNRLDLSEIPSEIENIISRCWAHDPSLRPQSYQVLERMEEIVIEEDYQNENYLIELISNDDEEEEEEENNNNNNNSNSDRDDPISSDVSLIFSSSFKTGISKINRSSTSSSRNNNISGSSSNNNIINSINSNNNNNNNNNNREQGRSPTHKKKTKGSYITTGRSLTINCLNRPTERLLNLFSEREYIPWNEFQNYLSTLLIANSIHIFPLKKLLVESPESDKVSKQTFTRLLGWFCPLYPEETVYENERYSIEGNKLSQIIYMLKQKWFHGFISAKEASDRLHGTEIGTFLIRFSETMSGTYAIAISCPEGTKHLRIIPSESKPVFILMGYECSSLFQIVDHFRKNPLPKTSISLSLACPKR